METEFTLQFEFSVRFPSLHSSIVVRRPGEKQIEMTPEERFDRIERNLEKNTEGTRDLIVLSRTMLTSTEKVLESQKAVTEQIKELREAQAETDAKLNMLIDTLDRIIRRLGKNNTKE